MFISTIFEIDRFLKDKNYYYDCYNWY